MRRIEEAAEAMGVSRLLLMENAGRGLSDIIVELRPAIEDARVVVVAGTGNNGGDGFVAARHLAGYGARPAVILLGEAGQIKTDEARANWRILEAMRETVRLYEAPSLESLRRLEAIILEADIVIDGIFGTGIRGAVREPHATAIDLINRSKGLKVAIDLPSGLDPATGEVRERVVRADITVTFHRAKKGLLDRQEYTGCVVVKPIGVPPEAEQRALG
jgi:NAD(P)H-hydrate epimerase